MSSLNTRFLERMSFQEMMKKSYQLKGILPKHKEKKSAYCFLCDSTNGVVFHSVGKEGEENKRI